MSEMNSDIFQKHWEQTEIIRAYEPSLFTFSDMNLPYILAAEHAQFHDRTFIRRGTVHIQKPQIILPGQYSGPQFGEGFEFADEIPDNAVYMFRAMGLPYSNITHKIIADERIEYGSLSETLKKLEQKLDEEHNRETGLVKGTMSGADISIMRYTITLIAQSAPENIRDFFDHMRRRRGEPIRPDEKVTDEDIRRLFEM